MDKIYTPTSKKRANWYTEVLYPISLFSIACMVLLLSSFSMKESLDNSKTNNTLNHVTNIEAVENYFAADDCCERTVSHTNGCNGTSNYVFYLKSDKKDGKGNSVTDSYYMTNSSHVSWIECEDQIHFLATNLASNGGTGEIIDVDITYSGLTTNPPSGSPKANACFSPSTNGWKYYTETNGVFDSNHHGSFSVTERGAAFQIGTGANTQADSGYGASGWLEVTGGDGYWIDGDVNVQLSTSCSPIGNPTDPTCNLSVNINGGTTTIDACPGQTVDLDATVTGASDCTGCCSRPIHDTNHCSSGNDYVLYVANSGNNKRFATDGLYWEECDNGSVRIHGQAKASDGEIALIDATYSGYTTSAPPTSPKASSCNGANGSGYSYYTRLCGTIKIGSTTYRLSRRGAAFQVGNGANVTHINTDYGASGWFSISGGSWSYGDFNIQLGSKTCGGNEVVYQWDDQNGSTTPSISVSPNTTTTYSVTAVDCRGCTDTKQITVSVGSNIVADAGPDQSICNGAKATLTASGGTEYQWSTGENTQTIMVMPSSTMTYSVIVSDGQGCSGTDEVTVEVGEFDGASASNDGPITCASGDITITALPNGNEYSWTGPGGFTSNLQSVQVGVAGTYMVTVTNPEGCEDTAETVVEANQAVPDAIATNDSPICEGGAVQIFGNSTTANVSYKWVGEGLNANQMISQNNTISGLAPGTYEYTLTVTNDDNGCETSATTTVEVIANPDSGISAQAQVCAGESAQFSAVPAVTGATYAWTFEGPATPSSSTDPIVDVVWPDIPGTYSISLEVTKDGCVSTYDAEIAVTFEVIANAGPDATICQGGNVVLDATDSQGNGYIWTVVTGDPTSIDLGSSANQATVSPSVTTTYSLQVDDVANNCTKVDEVTVFVDVNYNPVADAGDAQSICQASKVTLDGSASTPPPAEPNANISYFWSPAQLLDNPISPTPMATLTETTTFTLIVSTDNGCKDTSYVEITVLPCDIELEKTVSNETPNVGEVVSFTITASNTGGLPLTGIEIADNVPNGYSAISNISVGGSLVGNTITWSGISIGVSGSESVSFDAVVEVPIAGVDYLNTAQVTAMDQEDIDSAPDNDDGNQSEDDEDNAGVDPQVIDLSLIKTIDDPTPSVGNQVNFTITVSNAGPDNATGVTVTDMIPDGYGNVSAIGGTISGGNAVWSNVSIAAGASTSFTLSATVVAPATSYLNVAEVTDADQYDSDSTPGNGADTDGDGKIGSEDPDGNQDPDDEDDGDDATLIPNGSIEGTVLADSDNDGIGDTPLSGVTIQLLDLAGNVIATTVTDANGKYEFEGVAPGDYKLMEIDPDGYADVSDEDGSPDPDGADGTVDDMIPVTITAGETDADNDFVEVGLTSIWGDVTADTDGDGIGDSPISGVNITLKDATGNVIETTVTDADGKYDFVGLLPGDYTIEQTQPADYSDVSDQDGSPDGDAGDSDTAVDNSISVTTTPGEADMDNDFVEVGLTSIWGDVTADTDGDGIGDSPISGVNITLKDATGNVIETTVTDADGKYDFVGLLPGDYTVEETQPADYSDVSDQDGSPDGDAGDSDIAVDNSISVTTTPGEADMDNDFVEVGLTSIWGDVTADTDGDGIGDSPISGVNITLKDATGNVIETTVTDADGKYDFVGLLPGGYTVEETQPADYSDVSDQDGSPDGDAGDSDTAVDNSISVTTTPGEADMDNDFVEVGLTSIWGDVTADTDGDGIGDSPISGVNITLKDATGNVIETTVTDADGKYDFVGLLPGDYTVEETQPADYSDVSDQDGSPDGDAGDSDTAVDNSISVTTTPGEADMDNDFVEVGLTSIWGDVTADTNGDGIGDSPISGVNITLKDATGNVIETTVTDADGKYDFVGLLPGDYTVEETQPADYSDVSDQDGSPDGDAGDSDIAVDNSISVTTTPGEADMDNDFVEVGLTSIWGDVTADTDGDGIGDSPISGVNITLKDATGNVIETTVTDADGKYDFVGLLPGDYTVEETQPADYSDVSDQDGSPDGDAGDSDTAVDNSISVTTTPGEADMDNDFVEVGLTSIWGDVTADTDGDGIGDSPISGVNITLKDATGNVIETTVTDAEGKYDFVGLLPGDYTVEETQPADYSDVSDQDGSPDGDAGDSDTAVDNSISVTTTPGEADMDNDFVEVALASIGDFVWFDINGNGVQDMGEPGLEGVTVNLLDGNGDLVATTTSGPNGEYSFEGLVPGDYILEFITPAAYTQVVTTGTDRDNPINSDYDPVTGRTSVINLSAGENEDDIDAGFNLLLDISLVNFIGKYDEPRNVVTLSWTTSNEVNTDYFTIQRSYDNGSFESLERVDALGNTQSESSYEVDDATLFNSGQYQYRLMIVTNDGESSYSDIISVIVRKISVIEPTVKVYPNPVVELLNVQIVKNENEQVSAMLFDLTGKAMSVSNVQIESSGIQANIAIPVDHLPRAAYILRIDIGEQVFTKKITLIQ